jgi:hypothetical protein
MLTRAVLTWGCSLGGAALCSVAGGAAAAVRARRYGGSPRVAAGGTAPPHLQAGSRTELRRVDALVARGVQLVGDVGVLDRERPLRLDLALRSRPALESAYRAASTALRAVRDGGSPVVPAGSAAPPQLLAGASAELRRIHFGVAARVQLLEEVGALRGERLVVLDANLGPGAALHATLRAAVPPSAILHAWPPTHGRRRRSATTPSALSSG